MLKPLHISIVVIIVKVFVMERYSVNVSNVVKTLCYQVPWDLAQLKLNLMQVARIYCNQAITDWSGPQGIRRCWITNPYTHNTQPPSEAECYRPFKIENQKHLCQVIATFSHQSGLPLCSLSPSNDAECRSLAKHIHFIFCS